jgi:hypothetical protein
VKKRLLTVAFVSALVLSAVNGTLLVSVGQANPYHEMTYDAPPIISIFSPTQNEATPSNALLNFTVSKSNAWLIWANVTAGNLRNQLLRVNILIDGKLYRSVEANSYLTSPFSYSENLQNMTDGRHSLAVEADCEGWNFEIHQSWSKKLFYKASSDGINFTVYAVPPQIMLLSVANDTYEASAVPLVFAVNRTVSQISYSLDEEDNVIVDGNTTLAGLPNGEHCLTVYATDIVGNTGVSETVYFSVEVPFPTTMVIVPAASVAVLGVGLLVYFKRRKHKAGMVEL